MQNMPTSISIDSTTLTPRAGSLVARQPQMDGVGMRDASMRAYRTHSDVGSANDGIIQNTEGATVSTNNASDTCWNIISSHDAEQVCKLPGVDKNAVGRAKKPFYVGGCLSNSKTHHAQIQRHQWNRASSVIINNNIDLFIKRQT